MPAYDPVSLGIQTAAGLAEVAVGLINKGKAKKEAKELQRSRPKYEANDLGELDLAESELGTGGLSAKSESAYNQLTNRQFSTSLDAILRSGGSPNLVSDVFDSSEEGRLRLATLNDEIRMQKIGNLIGARRNMMEQQDKKFEFNEWMPWSDRAQANSEARQNAENMIWSGIDTIGGGGINAATEAFQGNNYNNYFNPRTPNTRNRNRTRRPMTGNGGYGQRRADIDEYDLYTQ